MKPIIKISNLLALFVLLFICLLPAKINATEPLILNPEIGEYSLAGHLEVLEDKEGKWSLEDILTNEKSGMFKSIQGFPNYGFTQSAFWVRFQLDNRPDKGSERLLDIPNPVLDDVRLFIPNEKSGYTVKKLGVKFPFRQREVQYQNFVFRISDNFNHSKYFYLRVKTLGPSITPLFLYNWLGFSEYSQLDRYLHGLFLGIFVIIILFSLILYLKVRESDFIYFFLWVFTYFLMQKSLFSFSYQYLWPESPLWQKLSYSVLVSSSVFFIILFTKNFLNITRKSGKIHYVFSGFLAMAFACILLSLTGSFVYYMNSFSIGLATLVVLLLLIYSIILLIQGNKSARYFFIAFMFFLIGGAINALMASNVLPYNLFTENSMKLGAVFQLSFLSLALADKINMLKEEKLQIQKEATRTLESKVAERTTELKDANEKLKSLDKTKSDFFANISHEFRTPLTLILSPLEAILQGKYSDSIRENESLFESMLRNGNRLIKLINNLLDFTRLEAGKTVLQKKLTDIPGLLEYFTASVESHAKLKGLKIKFQNNNHGLMANIDRDLFEKAIFNLISNAFKFTPEGGEIEIALDEGSAGTFRVSVKDTGIGIPHDKKGYIFERFGQLDTVTSRKFEGTGIGLALTKEIVGFSGGAISVESEPGKGSRFIITLPVGKPPEGAKSISRLQGEYEIKPYLLSEFNDKVLGRPLSDLNHPVKHAGSTVLIVEDSADMTTYLAGLLAPLYNISTAKNGSEGIEKARSEKPDLILSDVMMPEMDGYEMTKRIRLEPDLKGIPVILLTARADAEMKIEGIELGAVDYITKPFNPRELLARIGSQLELKKLRDELKNANQHLQHTLNDSSILVSDVGHKFYNELWSITQMTNVVSDLLSEISGRGVALDQDLISYAASSLEKSKQSIENIELMKEKIKANFGKKVERYAVKIRQFLETILVEYRKLLPAEEIELEEQVELAGEPVIMGNAEQLMIALTNILNNSRQMFKAFEPSRRKVIKFAARLKAGSLELVIEDNGTGIADADIENIFTMFYSTKEKSIGTGSLGMGLAIARWVMEDCHQGRIRVESRAGKFARFVIELPVAE